MTVYYPSAIDTWSPYVDDVSDWMAEDTNRLHALIIAVQAVLGIDPQGPDSDVSARIATLE
jgi:hypothetical protein